MLKTQKGKTPETLESKNPDSLENVTLCLLFSLQGPLNRIQALQTAWRTWEPLGFLEAWSSQVDHVM